MQFLSALLAGSLFGLGLTVSGMVDPGKVIGFLDITGQWDPSLALVMGGGLLIYLPGYLWLVKSTSKPFFAKKFTIPTIKIIDRKLITGAVLFGIGWGLAGFCPGPALASLAGGSVPIVIFVVSMLLGIKLVDRLT